MLVTQHLLCRLIQHLHSSQKKTKRRVSRSITMPTSTPTIQYREEYSSIRTTCTQLSLHITHRPLDPPPIKIKSPKSQPQNASNAKTPFVKYAESQASKEAPNTLLMTHNARAVPHPHSHGVLHALHGRPAVRVVS